MFKKLVGQQILTILLFFFASALFVYAQSAANPFSCATPRPEVKVGAKNICVQRIKWFLNEYLDPSPKFDLEGDGATTFDAKTQEQVKRWQNEVKLNCRDGVVGPETWNSLEPELAMQGPCVEGTIKTGGEQVSSGGEYSDSLTKECQAIAQNFSSFGGSIPGSLPAYCYSPGQGVTKIIRLVFAFLGMLAVLFIVIGGYRYITSGGDDKKAAQGKKTIQWALVGLVVALSAYAIVSIATRFAVTSSIL